MADDYYVKEEGGKEVVYKSGVVDTRVGELETNWDGSKSTTNIVGDRVSFDSDNRPIGSESVNLEAEVISGSVNGVEGTFRDDGYWNPASGGSHGFHPNEDTSDPTQGSNSGSSSYEEPHVSEHYDGSEDAYADQVNFEHRMQQLNTSTPSSTRTPSQKSGSLLGDIIKTGVGLAAGAALIGLAAQGEGGFSTGESSKPRPEPKPQEPEKPKRVYHTYDGKPATPEQKARIDRMMDATEAHQREVQRQNAAMAHWYAHQPKQEPTVERTQQRILTKQKQAQNLGVSLNQYGQVHFSLIQHRERSTWSNSLITNKLERVLLNGFREDLERLSDGRPINVRRGYTKGKEGIDVEVRTLRMNAYLHYRQEELWDTSGVINAYRPHGVTHFSLQTLLKQGEDPINSSIIFSNLREEDFFYWGGPGIGSTNDRKDWDYSNFPPDNLPRYAKTGIKEKFRRTNWGNNWTFPTTKNWFDSFSRRMTKSRSK